MLDVFRFSSYRTYLKEYYELEKASGRQARQASLAKAFGMSPAGLNLILTGKRNLTVEGIHDIARALKFTTAERDYFEALVLAEQTENANTRIFYSRRLKKIESGTKVKRARISDRSVLSAWSLPALLIYLIDVERISERSLAPRRVSALASRFKLNESQVKEVLEKFLEARLLQIKPEEQIHFVFSKVANQGPEKTFIRETIKESLDRVEKSYGSDDSFFFSSAFSIDSEKIPAFREKLKSVIDHYIAHDPAAAKELRILQTNIQFFSC